MRHALLLAMILCVAGCAKWVNPDLTDSESSKRRLAEDTAICEAIKNETLPEQYGLDRESTVPIDVEQMANQLHNWVDETDRDVIFDRCMQDRGWRRRR